MTKLSFLLAFTIAGYNVDCIRSFNERKATEPAIEVTMKRRRSQRRTGTWYELIYGTKVEPAWDPPGD